jgi:hypothetical protein
VGQVSDRPPARAVAHHRVTELDHPLRRVRVLRQRLIHQGELQAGQRADHDLLRQRLDVGGHDRGLHDRPAGRAADRGQPWQARGRDRQPRPRRVDGDEVRRGGKGPELAEQDQAAE